MAYYAETYSTEASNVLPGGKAGAALSVGDLVYLDSSGVWQKAVATAAGTAPASRTNALGVIVRDALANEFINPVRRALLSGWTGLTIGAPVYLSATAATSTQTSPGLAYTRQIVGYAVSATKIYFNVPDTNSNEDASFGIVVKTGSHVCAGGDVTEAITVTGCTVTDFAFVQVCSVGVTPVTVSRSDTTTSAGFVTVTLSADPGTDHKLAYVVLRSKS